jgi:hypothetical protein
MLREKEVQGIKAFFQAKQLDEQYQLAFNRLQRFQFRSLRFQLYTSKKV